MGVSYGRYKAMQEPVQITPPERRGTWRKCPWCGQEFVRYDNIRAIYCGVDCQKAFQQFQKYQRRKNK